MFMYEQICPPLNQVVEGCEKLLQKVDLLSTFSDNFLQHSTTLFKGGQI